MMITLQMNYRSTESNSQHHDFIPNITLLLQLQPTSNSNEKLSNCILHMYVFFVLCNTCSFIHFTVLLFIPLAIISLLIFSFDYVHVDGWKLQNTADNTTSFSLQIYCICGRLTIIASGHLSKLIRWICEEGKRSTLNITQWADKSY